MISLVIGVAVVMGCAYSLRRPAAGLIGLVAVTPFYTVLRETSAGSPFFFVWPYVIVGVLLLALVDRELGAWLRSRPSVPNITRIRKAFVVGAVLLLGALEWQSGLVRTIVGDTTLATVGGVLSGPFFQAAAVLVLGALCVTCLVFLRAIRGREGRWHPLDIAMVAFIVYGIVHIGITYARNGVLFTGLNGFRYYFSGAVLYLPARYFLTTTTHYRHFAVALVAAGVLGTVLLLTESYLLNVRHWPPDQLPWVGHLVSQFGYGPSPKAFFTGAYVPMGALHFTHVSGLVLVLAIAVLLPHVMASSATRRWWGGLGLLAVLVLGAHWTSRTGLILLTVITLGVFVLSQAPWRRRVLTVVVVVCTVIVGARFLIPGAVYDVRADVAFLGGRAFPNLIHAMGEDLFEATGRRILGSTVPTEEVLPAAADGAVVTVAPLSWLLFGRGAEFGTWNQVFFKEQTAGQFAVASFSDTKYLEFAQQFGAVGVLLLVAIHLLAGRAAWRARTRNRPLALALAGAVTVSAVSLGHLPTLFLIGFGMPAYVAFALAAAHDSRC